MSYLRISLAYAIDTLLFTPFRTFSSLYFLEFMSPESVGLLFAFSNVGRIIGTLIAGPLSDRLGRKTAMIPAYAAAMLTLPLVFENPRVFYPLLGAFRSIYVVTGEAAIYESSPEEAKAFGFAVALSLTDVAYIAALLGFAHFFDDDVSGIVARSRRLSVPAAIFGPILIAGSEFREAARAEGSYADLLADPRIAAYVALVSIYRLIAPFLFIFGVPILYAKGLGPREISYILSIASAAETIISPVAARIARPTELYLAGQAMRMSARMAIPFVFDRRLVAELYFLSVLAYSLIGPAGGAIDAGVMPDEMRATGISLVRASTTIAYTIGSYLAGFLYATLGIRAAFYVAATLLSIASVVAIYVRRTRGI